MGTFAADVLEDVKREAHASRVKLSAEILPRLEEVVQLLSQAGAQRLAGVPDLELEKILAARFQLLSSAAGLEVAGIVRRAARARMEGAVQALFGVLIAAVAP